MKVRISSLALAAILFVGIAVPVKSQDHYEGRVFTPVKGQELKYRLMIPKDYSFTGTEKYPLVLFLHGAGERGDDNIKQLVHGTKEFAKDENRQKYPCFVVAPQCPDGKRWVEVDWSANSHQQPEESISLELTRELLTSLQKTFRIDEMRLYVTGLSMGGFGTWDLITRTPNVFAAAVPICGGGDEAVADRLVTVPIWAFHGAQDSVVKADRSRRMIAAIQKAGGKPQYTEYADLNHDSWSRTYADPEMMRWLFAQKRP